jgi:3-oxoacyl-[acyl-carrier protein] reductase
MDLGIAGRVAIVSGGSSGLGFACAEALAAEGVHPMLLARTAATVEAAAAALAETFGVPARALALDIGDAASLETLRAACPEPDILVTNAAGPPPGTLGQWTDAEWDAALALNFRAPMRLIRAFVPGMAERGFGRVVNITSNVLRHPMEMLGMSVAVRAALHGLVASQVRLHARHNVTINNLMPGSFDTARLRSNFAFRARREGRTLDEVIAARTEELPPRRFGRPSELGRLCAFLCSADAGYITGQNICVDGGATATTL